MSVEKIINSWKKKDFKPVYWLEGEEDYFIDILMQYAEHSILPEADAAFNLTVFYGKDADWTAVINACKRYPMFAERQVVLLKEAQHMKDIENLLPYFESPLSSTVFVVGYKTKTYDKRKAFYKTVSKNAEVFLSAKLKEDKVHGWITEFVKSKGFLISPRAAGLLEEHIGNDLSRIANEIDKLAINIPGKTNIDEDDIEKYIGISKEYNIFELLGAICNKDLARAITIINYFEGNPKAAPIQAALPALYFNISKVYTLFSSNDHSEAALKPHFFYNPNSVKQAQGMIRNYGLPGVEKLVLLLHHYNLKGIGIGDNNTRDAELMKEMVSKMILD